MNKQDKTFFRAFCAGVTLTYICTGHLFLAGATVTTWGLTEYGLKKQEAKRER